MVKKYEKKTMKERTQEAENRGYTWFALLKSWANRRRR